MTKRPQLPVIDTLAGDEMVRVGKQGMSAQAAVATVRGPAPVLPGKVHRSGTFTTNSAGSITIQNVPAEATILKVSPRTDGAVQRSVTRSGTTVTVQFRVLRTGILSGIISTLFETGGVVVFDFEASEPVS